MKSLLEIAEKNSYFASQVYYYSSYLHKHKTGVATIDMLCPKEIEVEVNEKGHGSGFRPNYGTGKINLITAGRQAEKEFGLGTSLGK